MLIKNQLLFNNDKKINYQSIIINNQLLFDNS